MITTTTDPYVDHVRTVLGPDASPDVLNLAAALALHAEPDGRVLVSADVIAEESGTDVRTTFSALRLAGLAVSVGPAGKSVPRIVRRDGVPSSVAEGPRSLPSQRVAETPADGPRVTGRDGKSYPVRKGTDAKPRTPPQAGPETRKPIDQNDHMWSIINPDTLKGSVQHVAIVACMLLGAAATAQHKPYAEVTRNMTPAYLGRKSNTSESTARRAMEASVKAGYFERVDTARGGRPRKDAPNPGQAVYRPTVPEWVQPYGRL